MAVLLMEKDTKQNKLILYYPTTHGVSGCNQEKRERERERERKGLSRALLRVKSNKKLAIEAVHALDLLQIQMASSTQKDGYKVLPQNDS